MLTVITILAFAFVGVPLVGLLREGTVDAAYHYWVRWWLAPVSAGALLALAVLLYNRF